MKAVQVVLDEELLREVDRRRKRIHISRSEFLRRAARLQLDQIRTEEMEARHRRGYERFPPDEFASWDKVGGWPEE